MILTRTYCSIAPLFLRCTLVPPYIQCGAHYSYMSSFWGAADIITILIMIIVAHLWRSWFLDFWAHPWVCLMFVAPYRLAFVDLVPLLRSGIFFFGSHASRQSNTSYSDPTASTAVIQQQNCCVPISFVCAFSGAYMI